MVFTFLMTAALAGAVLAGASVSTVTGGSVHDLLRGAGFGWNSEIMAEQRRQATALQKMEVAVTRARVDVALLNARVDEAENLYQEAVNAVPGTSAPVGPAPGASVPGASVPGAPVAGAPVPARLSQGDSEFDLGALRSSLDEQAEHNRNEIRAVNRRIDWIEKLIYGPEGAVQPAGTAPRKPRRLAHGWRVLRADTGGAVISGKGGAIGVTPGVAVPNLGRIAAIRQERGRWVVVTENGMTIREQ